MALTTPTTPLTLLEAVNVLLRAVSKQQVMTLEATQTNERARQALTELQNASVQVQSREWHFNRDFDFPLIPDAITGEIKLPPNAQFNGTAQRSSYRFVTVRNNRLYDLKNHTFAWIDGNNGTSFNRDPLNGPLFVNIVWFFPFEQLEEPIRWLITATAGRLFGVGKVPDQDTYSFTNAILQDAEARAMQWETSCSSLYAEDNPHFFYMRKR